MTILVTGGNGFLGSHMVRKFLSLGYAVSATKREGSNIALIGDLLSTIKWYDVDLHDIPLLEEVVAGHDVVVHCAAVVTMANEKKNSIIKANTDSTANIVNICLALRVGKLIHISSIAALGKPLTNEMLNEGHKWQNSKSNTQYAISKYLAEQEVWRGHFEGLNVVILNPSFILGEGNWDKTSTQIVRRIDKGVFFYPRGSTGFVDVNDVVNAACICLGNGFIGERFIVNGHNLSFQYIMDNIADRLGRPTGKYPIKPWFGSLAWRLASVVSFFTRQAPVITKQTVVSTAQNYAYDNAKSRNILGLHYTPIDDTIDRMVKRYLED